MHVKGQATRTLKKQQGSKRTIYTKANGHMWTSTLKQQDSNATIIFLSFNSH